MIGVRGSRFLVTATILGVLALGGAQASAGGSTVFIKADAVHVGDGSVVKGGGILIVDGVIVGVGKGLSIPASAEIIELENASATPGLIDANALLEPDDLMTPSRRSARQVMHDIFCPMHHDEPVAGCCGSTCSLASMHVTGQSCPACGFPDAAPDADLAVGTTPGVSRAEHSSEIVPDTRVIDTVNLRSPDMVRLLGGGVTTVFVTPDNASVISSQGAIVRTGGPVLDRVVREAGAVKAVMGSDPIRHGRRNSVPFRKLVTFHSRRPTTRMGVTWVYRKAFHDSKRFSEGLEVHGADAPTPAAMTVLSKVLVGDIPLRIHAREQRDILTAIRLAEEFETPFILEEATEAHLCVDEIKAMGCTVVFGPIFVSPSGSRSWSGEADESRLHTMRALLDAGVPTALTANDLRDEDGLARQAMYARRYGLSQAEAVQSVTLTPARILGISDRFGSLEAGKRGDVVVWNGEPFSATSSPTVVLVDGEVVVDRRGG